MFNIFSVCFAFFVTTQWSSCYASTTAEQREKINDICRKASTIAAVGYTEEADNLARETTIDILDYFEVTEPSQVFDLFDAFLKMELFQAFNTQYGRTKTHDHRIIYDFLSAFDKKEVVAPNKKKHLTRLTVLSLAAQEFFWNPKSTVEDLKKRVKCELRFGLFKKPGNPLDVSTLIHLEGGELESIVNGLVNDGFKTTISSLLTSFYTRSLGNTYSQILEAVQAAQTKKTYSALELHSIPRHAEFEIADVVQAAKHISSGGGLQCGFNSLFIPTEDSIYGTSDGTARAKIIHSLEDDIGDPQIRRLYLFNSSYCEASIITSVCDPLIARQREILRSSDVMSEINAADRAILTLEGLKRQFALYKKQKEDELEEEKKQGRAKLKEDFISMKSELIEAMDTYKKHVKTLSRKQEHTKLAPCIKALLYNRINLNKASDLFEEPIISNFVIFEFFEKLCKVLENEELEKRVSSTYSMYSDFCSDKTTKHQNNIKDYIFEQIMPVIESIDASYLPDNGDLTRMAREMAMNRGADMLLECAEPYVQHWAMRQNLNIVVFSASQLGYQPPLECLVRKSDEKFSDSVTTYPEVYVTPKIATVILTSPTAKTLFLTKTTGHYDKLIAEDDLITIARQMRQTALMDLLTLTASELDLSSASNFDWYSLSDEGFDWSSFVPAEDFDWGTYE